MNRVRAQLVPWMSMEAMAEDICLDDVVAGWEYFSASMVSNIIDNHAFVLYNEAVKEYFGNT